MSSCAICGKELKKEEVWNSGEVQGKWNVLG